MQNYFGVLHHKAWHFISFSIPNHLSPLMVMYCWVPLHCTSYPNMLINQSICQLFPAFCQCPIHMNDHSTSFTTSRKNYNDLHKMIFVSKEEYMSASFHLMQCFACEWWPSFGHNISILWPLGDHATLDRQLRGFVVIAVYSTGSLSVGKRVLLDTLS